MPQRADRIILFDGICNLCNRTVAFVIRRDPEALFRFAALQSPTGQGILERFSLPRASLDTIVLVDGASVYTRSAAALEISRRLRGPWRLFYVLRWIPRPIRDFLYDQVANRRYRFWGRRESCMVPTADVRDRFLS